MIEETHPFSPDYVSNWNPVGSFEEGFVNDFFRPMDVA